MKMSEKNFFLMVSLPVVGIFDDPQTLFDELALRPYPIATVIRTDNLPEANFLAFQKYGIAFYGQQQDGTSRPMSLPVTGKYILSTLAGAEVEEPSDVSCANMLPYAHPIDFGGTWGVSAINGFGAGFNLSDMVTALLKDLLVYPTSCWFQNFPSAIAWAQGDYVRRFFSRFLGTSIAPRIPNPTQMIPGQMFIDADYASNSETRVENELLAKLLSFGLIS